MALRYESVGVDADSGLVHTVVGTVANVNDVTRASALVHGEERDVFADAGYQGVGKREETQGIKANWHVAMRPGKRRALDRATLMGRVFDELEHVKARIHTLAHLPLSAMSHGWTNTLHSRPTPHQSHGRANRHIQAMDPHR